MLRMTWIGATEFVLGLGIGLDSCACLGRGCMGEMFRSSDCPEVVLVTALVSDTKDRCISAIDAVTASRLQNKVLATCAS